MIFCVENEVDAKFDFDIEQIAHSVCEEVLKSENFPEEAQIGEIVVADVQGVHVPAEANHGKLLDGMPLGGVNMLGRKGGGVRPYGVLRKAHGQAELHAGKARVKVLRPDVIHGNVEHVHLLQQGETAQESIERVPVRDFFDIVQVKVFRIRIRAERTPAVRFRGRRSEKRGKKQQKQQHGSGAHRNSGPPFLLSENPD